MSEEFLLQEKNEDFSFSFSECLNIEFYSFSQKSILLIPSVTFLIIF